MTQKLLTSVFVIVLITSLFISPSFSVDIKEFTTANVELSDLTDIQVLRKQAEENSKNLKEIEELTASEIRQMRAAAIVFLATTINNLPDSAFLSSPPTSKSIFGQNIQEIRKLVEGGYDYGAYLRLLDLKGNVKSNINEPTSQLKVNQIIDDIAFSIKKQSLPLSVELPPPLILLESPLKQFKKGIPIDEILCRGDLVLIKKSVTGTPGCFKMSSVQKITERGWGMELNSSMKMP